MSRKDKITPSVVDAVREQTAQAAALAEIDGQDRLADPRLNPATRRRADELRTEQLTRALDAEHARLLRRHRVADRRAAEAEETLAAIALARQASSPARSVLALHQGRRLYARGAVAASVVLAVGSALGVETAAQALGAPTGTGYCAEVGLTGLSTAAILYRAHLAEHRGVLGRGWQAWALWALMIVPLAASITANLATGNALGAACALGAAAFSVLACVVADRSAAAMQARAAEVSAEDETELERVAMGEDHFAPIQPTDVVVDEAESGMRRPDERDRTRTRTREKKSDLDVPTAAGGDDVHEAVEELEAWLASQEPPEAGASAAVQPRPEGDPDGAAADADPDPARGHIDLNPEGGRIDPAGQRQGGHIDAEQGEHAARRVLPATQARLAVGAATRGRIADYLAKNPNATTPEIAAKLSLSVATVKRHRRQIRRAAGGEH